MSLLVEDADNQLYFLDLRGFDRLVSRAVHTDTDETTRTALLEGAVYLYPHFEFVRAEDGTR